MKILFSPSEAKSDLDEFEPVNENSFIFKELFSKRKMVLDLYNDFVAKADLKELSKLFGFKDEKEILTFKKDIFKAPTCEAIKRYTGVGFSYLNFQALDESSMAWILQNCLIFSNLFGPLLAGDKIPNYKLKQGAKLPNFNIEEFYKTHFSQALDAFLQDEELVDLRANFYEKFYTPKKSFTTYKFFKNGKVVSHFAKAYRGILLQVAAKIKANSNKALLENLPPNLKVLEIKKIGLKQEICLEIL